ncbi:hypothetical protein T310_1585 [Rasamsonia emersonii CBS 393.64]|uniref:Uncharacterized protein n=1 Tax=Rasamsonia emersonii (strain ATCC 16479 / CBS 393.64 / IMI 116815) TaxID=1408163 RepID=A0A0F4Z215_RASE3|nr:hypothetical protein T310_1585 [Rasamsonia emersonii CBS 393.64]KKA24400.1 hypothetical protein T310_1585 [Rasamsonia emersonii CBS 393.64]
MPLFWSVLLRLSYGCVALRVADGAQPYRITTGSGEQQHNIIIAALMTTSPASYTSSHSSSSYYPSSCSSISAPRTYPVSSVSPPPRRSRQPQPDRPDELRARDHLASLIRKHGPPTPVLSTSSLRKLTSTSPIPSPRLPPSSLDTPPASPTAFESSYVSASGTQPIPIPRANSNRCLDAFPLTPLTGRFDQCHFFPQEQQSSQPRPGARNRRERKESGRAILLLLLLLLLLLFVLPFHLHEDNAELAWTIPDHVFSVGTSPLAKALAQAEPFVPGKPAPFPSGRLPVAKQFIQQLVLTAEIPWLSGVVRVLARCTTAVSRADSLQCDFSAQFLPHQLLQAFSAATRSAQKSGSRHPVDSRGSRGLHGCWIGQQRRQFLAASPRRETSGTGSRATGIVPVHGIQGPVMSVLLSLSGMDNLRGWREIYFHLRSTNL